MSLKITSTQLVYNAGNIYYFTKNVYNASDTFYIYTNYNTLINLDRIIIYNTLTRDIGNILTTDVVNNIYLYRNWKDSNFAVFKRNIDQEIIDKTSFGIVTPFPDTMITNLKRVGGNILNPQRLILGSDSFGATLISANFLS